MKQLFVTSFLLILFLAPVVEGQWWRGRLRGLDASISAVLREDSFDTLIPAPDVPYRNRVMIFRRKLLEQNSVDSRVAVLNQESDVQKKLREILYPVRIDPSAKLAIKLDLQTNTLEVLPNTPVRRNPARKKREQVNPDQANPVQKERSKSSLGSNAS